MLTIPSICQDRIAKELASLPEIHGKVTLTITFNCTTSKVIGTMDIEVSKKDQMRL